MGGWHPLGYSTPRVGTACGKPHPNTSTGSTYPPPPAKSSTQSLRTNGLAGRTGATNSPAHHSILSIYPLASRAHLHAPLPLFPGATTPLGQGLEDIVPLFAALEAACKGISMLVQRAAIAGATGAAAGGGQNAGGDQQKKLDVVSNDLLKGFLARSGVVRVLASEEVMSAVH